MALRASSSGKLHTSSLRVHSSFFVGKQREAVVLATCLPVIWHIVGVQCSGTIVLWEVWVCVQAGSLYFLERKLNVKSFFSGKTKPGNAAGYPALLKHSVLNHLCSCPFFRLFTGFTLFFCWSGVGRNNLLFWPAVFSCGNVRLPLVKIGHCFACTLYSILDVTKFYGG